MNEEIQTPISCHKESDYLISSSDYENANNKVKFYMKKEILIERN